MLKEFQLTLGEKETYLVSLNSVIDLLWEKRDFDLQLAALQQRLWVQTDKTNEIDRGCSDLGSKLSHIRVKVGDIRKKAKLDDFEWKLGRLDEKVKKI